MKRPSPSSPSARASSTYGFNNLVDGWTGDEHERVINEERADKLGFKNAKL